MKYQVMPDLTPIEYEALKEDIRESGVLVPVEVDESGDLLDGHHRVRAWNELRAEGVDLPTYPQMVRKGMTEEQKRNHARKLNVMRRQLSRDQRSEVMKAMRADGMKYEEIAAAVGVSVGKVHGSVADVNFKSEIENTRGQKRPAKYQPRKPKAAPPATLFVPGEAEAIEPKAAAAQVKEERTRRAAEKESVRQEAIARGREVSPQGKRYCTLVASVAGSLSQIQPHSIDAIITDPPYPREYLPVYADLAAAAAIALKPGGSLFVMVGQSYLPDVFTALLSVPELVYNWTLAYLTPGGQAAQVFPRQVNTFWKPVIWCINAGKPAGRWVGDVTRSATNDNDKRFHKWGQSYSGMADLVTRLTEEGDTIWDPFCGGGTTGVAAILNGRQFVGSDIDAEQVSITAARLSEAQEFIDASV